MDITPTSFQILPEKGTDIIRDETRIVRDLLQEEATPEYQRLLENLDKTDYASRLAKTIETEYNKWPHRMKFDKNFFAGSASYASRIFGTSYRDYMQNGINLYNNSHWFTMAELGARLGLEAASIYLDPWHDVPEEISDTILASEYGTHLRDLNQFSDNELRWRIGRLRDSFPKVNGKKPRELVLHQIDSFKFLRGRILRILAQDIKQIKGLFVRDEDIFKMVVSLYAVTRTPGESYFETTDRISRISTYTNPLIFTPLPKSFRKRPAVFEEYLLSARRDSRELKLKDGLHNVSTLPDDVNDILKSLNKRLELVSFAKRSLVEEAANLVLIPAYRGEYILHLLVSQESAIASEAVYRRTYSDYSSLMICDPELKKDYGFRRNSKITIGDVIDRAIGVMRLYEDDGLMDRVTMQNDKEELDFQKAHYGISFGGTIKTITDYSDRVRTSALYNGFDDQRSIVNILQHTYSMKRLFERYLAINHQGNYDPSLRSKYLRFH